jgi:hypothetical protein
MNNKSKIAIILVLTGFVFLLVWLFNGNAETPTDSKEGKKAPSFVSSNWDNSFELVSKDPNGLYLFNYFIKAGLNNTTEIAKIDHPYSLDTIPRHTRPTFIFVGDEFVFNDQEIDSLFARIKSGSKLFLAQHTLDKKIYQRLFDNIEISYDYGLSTKVKTPQNSYAFYLIFQSDTIANKWKGYRNALLSGSQSHKTLSTLSGLENSIAIPYGKGYIYLCATPELFVNYQLKRKEGFYYSRTWLNRIPANENVYWLELGRFKKDENQFNEDEIEDGSDKRDDSYLQFIFQKKQLVYAMVLALFGVLLFLIFRSKRTQPVVPVIPPKKNMSLEFADTITSIYFSNRNPYVLLNIQKKNFYEAILKHFFVDLSKRTEDKEINSLSQKSTVDVFAIKEIITGFETTEVSSVDEDYLLQQSRRYLYFYTKSGMISTKTKSKLDTISFKVYRSFMISSVLLLLGIFTVFVGLYFLVQAIGVGILLWPIGALIITFALLRLSKPLASVADKTMNYYPLFGKSKRYELENLKEIDAHPAGATFIFHGGQQLSVNYSELSKLDAQQMKQFVVIQNKLKL